MLAAEAALLVATERRQRVDQVIIVDPDSAEANALSQDRKSTRLNSSHLGISYAVFCLKKKNSYKQLGSTYCANSNTLLRTKGQSKFQNVTSLLTTLTVNPSNTALVSS